MIQSEISNKSIISSNKFFLENIKLVAHDLGIKEDLVLKFVENFLKTHVYTFQQQLVKFCKEMTIGRDISHGEDHMSRVRDNAVYIFIRLKKNRLLDFETYRMVIAAAQFHDLADHKYKWSPQQQQSLETELNKHFTKEVTIDIINIMSAVSYSKEYKKRMKPSNPLDFTISLGERGALVRDIVSDADKLEAIGKIGVERCREYARHLILSKEYREATKQEVESHLVEHSKEKLLFLLKDNYIRTSIGRLLAFPLHKSMLDYICLLLREDEGRELREKVLIY